MCKTFSNVEYLSNNLIRFFLTATSGTKPIIASAGHVYILLHQREKWSTIQYGYRNRGTHARVFSQTLTHGNSQNEIRQWDRRRHTEERREYGKKYSGTNKWSSDGLSHPNKHNLVKFYKKWKKNNEIQLTKKMDLKNRKMTNHPPSPDWQ